MMIARSRIEASLLFTSATLLMFGFLSPSTAGKRSWFVATATPVMTIHGEAVDTVGDEIWRHTFTIQLFENHDIRESWVDARVNGTEQNNWHGTNTLGVNSDRMSWHVISEHKLQRVAKHGDFITFMTFEINGGKCHVDRQFLINRNYGGGSRWHLISASCSIE